MINGMTGVVFSSLTFAWLFFWMAGSVVTMSQRVTPEVSPAGALELAPVA
jgi:hypothetical protein